MLQVTCHKRLFYLSPACYPQNPSAYLATVEFFLPPDKRAVFLQRKREALLRKDIRRSRTIDQKWNDGRKLHPFLLPKVGQKATSGGLHLLSNQEMNAIRLTSFFKTEAAGTQITKTPEAEQVWQDPPAFPSEGHVRSISPHEDALLQRLYSLTKGPVMPPPVHRKSKGLSPTDCCLMDTSNGEKASHFVRTKGMRNRHPEEQDHKSKEEALQGLLADLTEVRSDTAYKRFEEMLGWLRIYLQRSSQGDMLWPSKYRPLAPSELVGNFNEINAVDAWLRSWQPTAAASGRRSSQTDMDGEDWVDDTARSNTLLISGPVGCGKTAAVYACAAGNVAHNLFFFESVLPNFLLLSARMARARSECVITAHRQKHFTVIWGSNAVSSHGHGSSTGRTRATINLFFGFLDAV